MIGWLTPSVAVALRSLRARTGASWAHLVWFWLFLASLCLASGVSPVAADNRPQTPHARFREGRILLMPKNLDVIPSLRSNHARRGIAVAHEFASLGHLQVLDLPAGANVREIIAQYQASGLVEFAEPDYLIHSAALPNDPAFANGTLWGLRNLGQNGGRAGMDINAPAAWDITHDAPTVIVAIIDSGIRETHQDLSANLSVNTA